MHKVVINLNVKKNQNVFFSFRRNKLTIGDGLLFEPKHFLSTFATSTGGGGEGEDSSLQSTKSISPFFFNKVKTIGQNVVFLF